MTSSQLLPKPDDTHDQELKHLQKEVERLRVVVSDRESQISLARQRADEIHSRHAAEMKAAKHLAHVRDLSRVSALREASLEKDKLMNELRYAKYVQHYTSVWHHISVWLHPSLVRLDLCHISVFSLRRYRY